MATQLSGNSPNAPRLSQQQQDQIQPATTASQFARAQFSYLQHQQQQQQHQHIHHQGQQSSQEAQAWIQMQHQHHFSSGTPHRFGETAAHQAHYQVPSFLDQGAPHFSQERLQNFSAPQVWPTGAQYLDSLRGRLDDTSALAGAMPEDYTSKAPSAAILQAARMSPKTYELSLLRSDSRDGGAFCSNTRSPGASADDVSLTKKQEQEWLNAGIANSVAAYPNLSLSKVPSRWYARRDSATDSRHSSTLEETTSSSDVATLASGVTRPASKIESDSNHHHLRNVQSIDSLNHAECSDAHDACDTSSDRSGGSPLASVGAETKSSSRPPQLKDVGESTIASMDATDQKRAEEILKCIRTRAPDSKEGVAACDYCRKRKIKCDRAKPSCGRCVSANRTCATTDTLRKRGPPSKKERELLAARGIHFVPSRFRRKSDLVTRNVRADGRCSDPGSQKGIASRRSDFTGVNASGRLAGFSAAVPSGDKAIIRMSLKEASVKLGVNSAASPKRRRTSASPSNLEDGRDGGGSSPAIRNRPSISRTLDDMSMRPPSLSKSALLPRKSPQTSVPADWTQGSGSNFSSSRNLFSHQTQGLSSGGGEAQSRAWIDGTSTMLNPTSYSGSNGASEMANEQQWDLPSYVGQDESSGKRAMYSQPPPPHNRLGSYAAGGQLSSSGLMPNAVLPGRYGSMSDFHQSAGQWQPRSDDVGDGGGGGAQQMSNQIGDAFRPVDQQQQQQEHHSYQHHANHLHRHHNHQHEQYQHLPEYYSQ